MINDISNDKGNKLLLSLITIIIIIIINKSNNYKYKQE